ASVARAASRIFSADFSPIPGSCASSSADLSSSSPRLVIPASASRSAVFSPTPSMSATGVWRRREACSIRDNACATSPLTSVALARAHRDFRALAGLPDRALDHDRAVVNLRDFHLEQPDEQPRIRARKHQLRALRVLVNVVQNRPDPLALSVSLRARLLVARD